MKIFILGILLISLSSCMKNTAKNMEIRYTSINDVYGNYVFNFNDSTSGLKMINDFVEKDIQESKKVADSVNNQMARLSTEEASKLMKGQSLPTSAGNITFYNAPSDFSGEPKAEDILIEYELDENNFKIKNLNVPAKKNAQVTVSAKNKTADTGIVKVSAKNININILNTVISEINKVRFHRHSDRYKYIVQGEEENQLMSIQYDQNGKYLKLSF
ncbi:MAG: hypothetical protein J6O88_00515 [Chryseobacterium sp.]|uniref:hypothetical protein n=1 Tax=Chryseobacterium sp. TaxID=1871047 RepID=UPI001B1F1B9F|nr:hypothetical protein [Chryseobacterium sp.]MBO6183160.1 hypothetical protein [Chryseobacterium sp.]